MPLRPVEQRSTLEGRSFIKSLFGPQFRITHLGFTPAFHRQTIALPKQQTSGSDRNASLSRFDNEFSLSIDRSRIGEIRSCRAARVGAHSARWGRERPFTICESVQRGLSSGAFDRGPYSMIREKAQHHFHRLLAGDLRAPAPFRPGCP